MKTSQVLTWVCQLLAAALLATAASSKFLSTEASVQLFTNLGMEPGGRYVVAVLEAAGALLLLTENFAAIGAVLGTSVMVGAGIAHATKLGFGSPAETIFWGACFASCHAVLYLRRKTIPLLGETL